MAGAVRGARRCSRLPPCALQLPFSTMTDEPQNGFTPGPLDEMVPGLRAPATRFAIADVHPRVVAMERDDGSHALVGATWRAPDTAQGLHGQLRPLVEAAFLAELSRPIGELRERRQDFSSLQLLSFAPFAFDAAPALRPFGLETVPARHPDFRKAAALLRREAAFVDAAGAELSTEPVAHHVAEFSGPAPEAITKATIALLKDAPDDPWGGVPGQLSHLFAHALSAEGLDGVAPTREGINTLERYLAPTAEGRIRWMGPVAFQALCDLLAVAAQGEWGMEVQWGVCDPDEETGLTPPPVIRAERPGRAGHIPLGEHVLRWCIMPRTPGEDVPALGDWAAHEFGE
jgi:hypothetical protein